MVTFEDRQVPKIGLVVDVFLDKYKTGTIYRVQGGWQYQAGKKHLGRILPSIDDVKQTLQS